MKDEETRRLFQRLYGFDIKKDHQVFQYTINTNTLTLDEAYGSLCHHLDSDKSIPR